MSPTLNGSTALQCFERGNAVEIRNGIMFDFYPGLPHMLTSGLWQLKVATIPVLSYFIHLELLNIDIDFTLRALFL